MCGFFGVVDFSESLNAKDWDEITAGTTAISYRGPDDSAILKRPNICFGFRRLSIIDIQAPSQPFSSKDKRTTMMCNGEIYNFQELKSILVGKNYQFQTNTDTEVILHGYEEWGHGLWEKLNGIFAVVLWDEIKKELTLVRDQFGVKPLHYLEVGNKIYFSSDYNAFKFQSARKMEMNSNALLSYFSFRYVVGEQTFYKDVYDILPGNFVKINVFGRKSNIYWDIPVEEDGDPGEKQCLKKLDELLSASVERQLMSDVPLGAFISGGVDSNLLLHYMSKTNSDISCYIAGFEEKKYNEFEYADLMAEKLGIKPRKLMMTQRDYLDAMEEVIAYRGEPVSVPHEGAFLRMSQLMKKEISVVLSGEGADELFAGYGRIFRSPFDYYKQRKIDALPFGSKLARKVFNVPSKPVFDTPMNHFLNRYSWFTNMDKNILLNQEFFNSKYFDDYSLSYINGLFSKTANVNYYRAMPYILGKIHLPNLLNRLDRMTMASGVEARVPFLDKDLVSYVSKLPCHYKLRWNSVFSRLISICSNSDKISEKYDTPKYILKQLAQGKVPAEIINRSKMGFPVPLDKWMGENIFKDKAKELLLSKESMVSNIVNTGNIENFLKKKNYSSSYDYDGKKIWMLMNVELWMRNTFS